MGDMVVVRKEGLYCVPGGFYIDPWRPVDRAVITHAHGDHARYGHGHYLSAAPGVNVLKSRLGELALDSQDFAHWDVEAAGPNWEVVTRYDFLRQEHIIRANMAEPLLRQIPRALAWAFDYVVSGAIFRVLRASPYFGLVLLYFQTMLIWWLLLSAAGGWLVALGTARVFGLGGWGNLAAVPVGILAAIAIFLALRPLANRLLHGQVARTSKRAR